MDDRERRLNLLVAYPYFRGDVREEIANSPKPIRLVVDSGAFTAWKLGTPIALDDYCRFLETLPVRPWRCFVLDVIGDPEGTERNYETMLKRGLNPVPIFTRGENPAALAAYYNTSDVVGIGGLVGTPGNSGFVRGIMRHVAGRRVHWLGFTNHDFLTAYRPYMADSSSWEGGARYGQLKLYMGAGKFVAVKRDTFRTRPAPAILERIRFLGFDPYSLREEASWRGGEGVIRKLCAASAVAYSLDVQRKLGTLLFCAAASAHAIRHLITGTPDV